MKKLLCILLLSLGLCSCTQDEVFEDTPQGNLEALWKILDEHYCFFEEKGIDWYAIYQRYSHQMNQQLTEYQQFQIMAKMLAELKDGHVNLYTSFDHGRYWKWHEDYPKNFDETLIDHYIGTDYRITAGMRYCILDDHVGYISCRSFEGAIGSGNLDNILFYLAPCNGLIIDIRGNGGGMLTSAEQLASRFTNEDLLVGYIQHKTGKRHQDFSRMREQILHPAKGVRWQKKVIVLTNREVFSAANEFVKYMKVCPQVTIVGDKTGGGAGLPFSSELPNGWGVRFSACPIFDANKKSTEFGIDPDHVVMMKKTDTLKGEDTLIEFARKLLSNTPFSTTTK